MYNKLVLENLGEEFEVVFDGGNHIVPSGKFEAEETLGNFIFGQASKWKLNVKKLSIPEPPKVKKIETVISEVKEDEVVESSTEEVAIETETKTETKTEKKRGFGYKI